MSYPKEKHEVANWGTWKRRVRTSYRFSSLYTASAFCVVGVLHATTRFQHTRHTLPPTNMRYPNTVHMIENRNGSCMQRGCVSDPWTRGVRLMIWRYVRGILTYRDYMYTSQENSQCLCSASPFSGICWITVSMVCVHAC